MQVNFHYYNETINILTNSKLPDNLYLKTIDTSGKLVDVCFLIKLFRIIARCFGFYQNATVAKELKTLLVKQLTPVFEPDPLARFAWIANKVRDQIDPLAETQITTPSSPIGGLSSFRVTPIPAIAPAIITTPPPTESLDPISHATPSSITEPLTMHPKPLIAKTPTPAPIQKRPPPSTKTIVPATILLDPSKQYSFSDFELMNTETFNRLLAMKLPADKLDECILPFLITVPLDKVSLVLTYAAKINPTYIDYSIEKAIDTLPPLDKTVKPQLVAIALLQLIRSPSEPNQHTRAKSLIFQVSFDAEVDLFAGQIAQLTKANDFKPFFSMLSHINGYVESKLTVIFKKLIAYDDTDKTVAAFICYWNIENKFRFFGSKEPKHTFNTIPSIKTLDAILTVLKEESLQTPTGDENDDTQEAEPIVQKKRLNAWLDILLMPHVYTTSGNLGKVFALEPQLHRDEIHLLLEIHHWVIETFSDDQRAGLHQFICRDVDLINLKTNCINWLSNLKNRPRITKMKAALPNQLATVLQNIVFEYWFAPIKL